MLAISLSLLFGFVAFAAFALIWLSVGTGMRRGRMILAELSDQERKTVKARSVRRPARREWPALLAAA